MKLVPRFPTPLRRLAVFSIGLGLVVAMGYLVVVQVRAQVALQQAALKQATFDSERRATALSYFFSEQRDFLRDLAESRALQAYFENRALGMSLAYGLQASLLVVQERFDQARQSKQLGEQLLYERLAFVDPAGRLLADSPPPGAKRGGQGDWQRFLAPASPGPAILCDRSGRELRIIISAPCFFKGRYAGQALGWISFPRIDHYFIEGKSEVSRYPDAIVFEREYLHIPSAARHLIPSGESTLPAEVQPGQSYEFPLTGRTSTGMGAHAMLVPVKATPFSLMTFIPATEPLDSRSPRQIVYTTGGLALLFLSAMFTLMRLNTNNARLRTRLEETILREKAVDEKNRELAAEIAERTRAEAEKARLSEELKQAHKMDSVGRLAGGVAHDFNNMLGVIIGHTDIAIESLDPSHPVHANLEEISKAANRSADLTRQLLAFAHKQTIAPRVMDLNETVAGMLKMLKRLIGENIDLRWRPGRGLWPVRVDPSQIDQILANLCVNARDAISGVGHLTIETGNRVILPGTAIPGALPGEYVLLAVSDDGCGMSEEVLPQIFEPFFTTKDIGQGTGLGLATVYGIVKQNRGFIEVRSEPSRGTVFEILLPRHSGEIERARPKAPVDGVLRGKETILLVEDEPVLLELTSQMVEMQGYQVLAAHSPGEALRLSEAHPGPIHLLMTDVVMPEMNGRDLARQLMSLYPQLRCLFISGYTSDVIAHHGVLEEGLHFLQKPYTAQVLAKKVREVLDGR
ncbi:MAG: ATP-binding protein [Geothrix sp.]|nr:ATP-binding protein [Geothrix sp.]